MNRARGASAMLLAALVCAAPLAVPAAASPRGGQVGGPGRGAAAGSPPAAAPAPEEPGVWLAGGAPPQSTPPLWQDRPLSAGEARQLQRLRQAARRWQAALAPLAAAASSQGDAALQADLARLDALLRSLAWAQQLTLASYAAALRASSDALALWRTDAAYVEPGEQQAWQEADAGAAELTTAAETGFVFGVDLGSGQTWSYAEGGAAEPGQDGAADGDGHEANAGATAEASPDMAVAMAVDDAPGLLAPEAGVDASLPAEAPAYELGDLQGDVLPAAPEAPISETDSESALAAAAPPLAWEEICRPWQPSAGAGAGAAGPASACLLSPAR